MSWKLIQKYRDILKEERGTVRKEWGGKLTVALTYPNSYHVAMSNLGFQTIYALLNSFDNVVCERVFLPDAQDIKEYQRTGTPLISLESQRALQDFDVIAFSISFENDYVNVLKILEMAKIPLLSEDRRDSHPLIIAGGVVTFLNPEPLSLFVDLFIIGEGEENLGEFISILNQSQGHRLNHLQTLERLVKEVPGVYVPRFYEVGYDAQGKIEYFRAKDGFPDKVESGCLKEIGQYITRTKILTPHTEFSDMLLVEIGRGCPHGCRFCAAGFIYRPPRMRDWSQLRDVSSKGIDETKRIGLVGAAVSDLPNIESLCKSITQMGGKASLSSLRASSLTKDLLEALKEGNSKTITIAPDAGSERLRRVINKGVTENDIIEAVTISARADIKTIKLYFMIGLPTETDDDVEAIIDLSKRLNHHILKLNKGKRRMAFNLSINCFVPKPFTPFQWVALEDVKSLKKKMGRIRNGLKGERNIRVTFDVPKWAYIQALLSRGDRNVGRIILAAHKLNGNWKQALRMVNINPDFYVYRKRDFDEILPWDFIDHGIKKDYLVEEYRRAIKAKTSPICQPESCHKCGIC
jgi:radical SAM family uncharacterized protein